MTHRYRTASGLLVIAALAAAAAATTSVLEWDGTPFEHRMTAVWRSVGLATFAVAFVVLATAPWRHLAIWSLTAANKLALTVVAAVELLRRDTPGAGETALWDGALLVVLVVAFVLARPGRHRSTAFRAVTAT